MQNAERNALAALERKYRKPSASIPGAVLIFDGRAASNNQNTKEKIVKNDEEAEKLIRQRVGAENTRRRFACSSSFTRVGVIA